MFVCFFRDSSVSVELGLHYCTFKELSLSISAITLLSPTAYKIIPLLQDLRTILIYEQLPQLPFINLKIHATQRLPVLHFCLHYL